jgi:hypothetical protein
LKRPSRHELLVLLTVEAKNCAVILDQDRSADEVRLRHHQVDGFLLGFGQRPLLEDRAARADEVEKAALVDVALEKRAIRWGPIDVPFGDR